MGNYITYEKIVERATACKNGVEKQKKLVTTPRWTYYICNAILTPKKNIPINPDMHTDKGNALKSVGHEFDKVKIYKADYMDCAKRIVAYIKKYHHLPASCTWNDKRISVKDYMYNMSKILVYYDTHKAYPTYNTIDTSVWNQNTIKKYGRSTKYGCDQRGQNNGYFCGPHMMQEIFRNLTGIVVSQSTLASVIGTTSDGSDHDGLNTSVSWFNKKYGYNLKVAWYNFNDLGWAGIKKILESKNQDCGLHELYRNTWGHYTNYDKVYNDYVDVHNSLGDYCTSSCYCGYTEERSLSTARSYLSGISQKSVMVVTNAG